MTTRSSTPFREITFRPGCPPATRTVSFLVRSVPLPIWAVMYLLFSSPLLWDNWQRLAEGPVPVWRWAAALAFPLMMFGFICVLQKSSYRLAFPATLRADGLHLGKRGRVKEFWSSVVCSIEPVKEVPGVYRLAIKAVTPLSKLFGHTVTVYSALTEDLAQAQRFANAFNARYGRTEEDE